MKARNLKCIHRVVLALGLKVGGVSLFRRIESAEMDVLAVNLDGGLPLIGPKLPCANEPAFAVATGTPLVLTVFGGCDVPKIAETVIVGNSVDVINVALRPVSGHVKVCKTVFRVFAPKNRELSVGVPFSLVSGAASRFGKMISRGLPHENSGFGVIIQKITQAFCGKIGLSHIVAPVKRWFGQKPDIAVNFVGLRYYSMELA